MRRILIIDDDTLIHFALNSAFREESGDLYDVRCVTTGRMAMEAVTSSTYSLCFIDIELPDVSGLDLMKQIIQSSPDTKVIVMSAGHVDDDMKRSIYEVASYYLKKPFDMFLVKSMVKHMFELQEG